MPYPKDNEVICHHVRTQFWLGLLLACDMNKLHNGYATSLPSYITAAVTAAD